MLFAKIRAMFLQKELREKILFTVMMLIVCRIGVFIPVPGIDGVKAVKIFQSAVGGSQNLFQLIDIFSGGAFSQMTIIALGVMPYITSSIILQLLMALIPSLQRDMKENPEVGKRKVGRWTRLLTVFFALFQSATYAKYALGINATSPGVISPDILSVQLFSIPVLFYLLVMLTMTAGTMFLMWIGEQISEYGIGNGVSLIITLGILSSFPRTIYSMVRQLNLDSQEPGQLTFSALLVLSAVFVLIILGTVLIIQGTRRVPLQHARAQSSSDSDVGEQAHIPLKINYAGVIPVIFASSFLMSMATLLQFFTGVEWLRGVQTFLSPGSNSYLVVYVSLIIFFTYFWTSMQFNPNQIASDLKRSGAFIPGVRQGKPTEDYLNETMNKITFAGAIFLSGIAVLPALVGKFLSVDQSISQFFGGTSLLILVGVVLDTMKQVDSHLIMKKYDGFISRRRTRARI